LLLLRAGVEWTPLFIIIIIIIIMSAPLSRLYVGTSSLYDGGYR